MNLPGQMSARRLHIIAIAVWGLLVHGLVLFNRAPFWDGWLIEFALRNGEYDALRREFASAGGTGYVVHWILGHLGGLIAYRIVAVCSPVVTAIVVYEINRREGYLSQGEGLLLSLLTVAYPGVRVSFELIMGPSDVYCALFFVGTWAALRAEDASSPSARVMLRVLALATLFLGFGVNSLLVFYFGVLFALFAKFARARRLGWLASLLPFLRRRADYLAIPFVFWAIKQIFLRTHGAYARAGYNQISFSPVAAIYQIVQQLWLSVYEPINGSIRSVLSVPLACAIFAVVVLRLCRKQDAGQVPVQTLPALGVAVFASLWLGLAILPYALVGDHATTTGWTSRHALLEPVPTCLLLVMAVRLVGASSLTRLSDAGVVVLTLFAGGFACTMVGSYLKYEARAAKDEAVIDYLSSHPEASHYSVFWVDDGIQFEGDTYRPYEWASMMRQAWHDESHVGLDLAAIPHDKTAAWLVDMAEDRAFYNIAAVDPAGPACRMSLRRGPNWGTESDARVAVQHLVYRYLRRGRLRGWLAGLVDVQIGPDTRT